TAPSVPPIRRVVRGWTGTGFVGGLGRDRVVRGAGGASRRLGEPGLLARSSRAEPDVREPVRRPADRCPGRAAAADRARPVNCPKKTTRAEREPVRRSSAAPLVTRLTRVSHLFGVDRKSTRLNSSHVKISYAVFCLKKKNTAIDAKQV